MYEPTDHINALSQQLCVLDVRLGEKNRCLQHARNELSAYNQKAAAATDEADKLIDELCRSELHCQMLQSRVHACTQEAKAQAEQASCQTVRQPLKRMLDYVHVVCFLDSVM